MLEEAGARPPEFFAAEIGSQVPRYRLSLGPAAVAGLSRYLAEADRWRRRMNLTGPLSAEELVSHALESTLGGQLIAHGARVLDIGSGAGLPGVPLAISRPDLSVTLLEPRVKRAAFLRHVVRSVPVENARVVEKRAEELSDEAYDVATTRAVGAVARVLRGAKFLGRQGGLLAWTTEPEEMEGALAPVFSLETVVTVPESHRRVIALFRRR